VDAAAARQAQEAARQAAEEAARQAAEALRQAAEALRQAAAAAARTSAPRTQSTFTQNQAGAGGPVLDPGGPSGASSLLTENINDRQVNCLDKVGDWLRLASPEIRGRSEVLFLRDTRPGQEGLSGHAVIRQGERIFDPMTGQTYNSFADFNKAGNYQIAGQLNGTAVARILSAPPGSPERQQAIEKARVPQQLAGMLVADSASGGPQATAARERIYQQAYEQALPAIYRNLPPEDQAALREGAQRTAQAAVARYDALLQQELGRLTPERLRGLPPEDRDALRQAAVAEAERRWTIESAGGSIAPYPGLEDATTLLTDVARGLVITDPDQDPRLSELHDFLIDNGFMEQSVRDTPGSGYGKNFGGKTADAIEAFQRSQGMRLPDDQYGTLTPETLERMENPRPAPSNFAAGPAVLHPELGAATSPVMTTETGGQRQYFEGGYVNLDANGNRSVHRLDNSIIEAPKTWPSLPTTVEEANAFFLSQAGDTPFTSGGMPDGLNDCGPTAALMALAVLGFIERPSPEDALATIEDMRQSINSSWTTSTTMTLDEVVIGIRDKLADGTDLSPRTVDQIDAALDRGNPVIAGGYPLRAWGLELINAGNYLHNNRNKDPAHFVAVLGRSERLDENGNSYYLVADPLSKTGVIEVSREELSTFLGNNSIGLMEVHAPGGGPAESPGA
jgi:hypothetical protein